MAVGTGDRRRRQVLAGASRAAVLEVLSRSGSPLGVADVADRLGLHPNTVRGHLDVLAEAGYVVRSPAPPAGRGRPRVVYRATDAPEERNYRLLSEVLVGYLLATSEQPARAAASAGRAYAEQEFPQQARGGGAAGAGGGAAGTGGGAGAGGGVAAVVGALADLGFAPELGDEGASIRLRHCPFRELADRQRDVVCGAHLGLIQGALARSASGVTAVRLRPFVEAELCVVSLETSAG